MTHHLQKRLTLSVVVPTFNNDKTIVSEIQSIRNIIKKYTNNFEILIGNDMSSDQTGPLLQKYFSSDKKIKLYHHRSNLGIAGNIRFLYKKAKNAYILLYSGDGEWNVNDTGALLDSLLTHNVEMVLGKRTEKRGYSVLRNLISSLYNTLPILFFGVRTVDAGSIKVFHRKLLDCRITSKGVFQDAELVIRAKKKGYRVLSCPVNYKRDILRRGSPANMKNITQAMLDIIVLRFSRI